MKQYIITVDTWYKDRFEDSTYILCDEENLEEVLDQVKNGFDEGKPHNIRIFAIDTEVTEHYDVKTKFDN